MKENVEQPKQYPKVEDIENLAKLQEESECIYMYSHDVNDIHVGKLNWIEKAAIFYHACN